jgi:hypothetical protein
MSRMTSEQLALYRAMSPAQRLRVAFDLHDFVYRRLERVVASEGRSLTERELRLELLRRCVGEPGGLLRGGPDRA